MIDKTHCFFLFAIEYRGITICYWWVRTIEMFMYTFSDPERGWGIGYQSKLSSIRSVSLDRVDRL